MGGARGVIVIVIGNGQLRLAQGHKYVVRINLIKNGSLVWLINIAPCKMYTNLLR